MKTLNTFLKASLVAAVLFVFSGTTQAKVIIKVRPPAAKVTVVKTKSPYKNGVWVKGRWSWRNGRYVWVKGYWKKPRHGYVWVPGHWTNRSKGWVWVGGHWKRV